MARKRTWLCRKLSGGIGHGSLTASPRASQKRPRSKSAASIRAAVPVQLRQSNRHFYSTGIALNQSHIESLHMINRPAALNRSANEKKSRVYLCRQ